MYQSSFTFPHCAIIWWFISLPVYGQPFIGWASIWWQVTSLMSPSLLLNGMLIVTLFFVYFFHHQIGHLGLSSHLLCLAREAQKFRFYTLPLSGHSSLTMSASIDILADGDCLCLPLVYLIYRKMYWFEKKAICALGFASVSCVSLEKLCRLRNPQKYTDSCLPLWLLPRWKFWAAALCK